MAPPIWVDRFGRRRTLRHCWQCGAEDPVLWLQLDDFRRLGWNPCQVQNIPNWCGHAQLFIPWPDRPGWWRFVPVWEPPARARQPLERSEPAPAAASDSLTEPA